MCFSGRSVEDPCIELQFLPGLDRRGEGKCSVLVGREAAHNLEGKGDGDGCVSVHFVCIERVCMVRSLFVVDDLTPSQRECLLLVSSPGQTPGTHECGARREMVAVVLRACTCRRTCARVVRAGASVSACGVISDRGASRDARAVLWPVPAKRRATVSVLDTGLTPPDPGPTPRKKSAPAPGSPPRSGRPAFLRARSRAPAAARDRLRRRPSRQSGPS